MTRPDPTDLEDLLRAALRAEADSVTPGERLADVRARVATEASPPARARGWALSALAAAAVVAMVVLGVNWRATVTGNPAGHGVTGASESAWSDSPATGRPPQSAPTGAALPVFVLVSITEPGPGETAARQRWALQRWFIASDLPSPPPAGPAVLAAVRRALGLGTIELSRPAPFDGVSVLDVQLAPDLITITLSGGGTPITEPARAEIARLSVQQLVWTAQAAYGRRVPVTFRLADGGERLLGRFLAADRYDRPDSDRIAADVAPVWIDRPAAGATVPAGRPITVSGLADVPGGRLVWSVLGEPDPATGASTLAPPTTAGPPQSTTPTHNARLLTGTARADQGTEGGPSSQLRYTTQIPALAPGLYRLEVGYPVAGSADPAGVAGIDIVVD